MYGGAATNLAVALRKIPITVLTVRFLIIKTPLVHEVDWFRSLLRELDLVSTNIFTELNVVLLGEVMIVQGRAVLKAMLPSTYNAMLRISSIWIFSDRMYCSAITIKSKQVIGSFFSIGDFNL